MRENSFEKFLIKRLGINRDSRTTAGNLVCKQAEIYDQESQGYAKENLGKIFGDLTGNCRGMAVGNDISASLTFLRGGEDFALERLPQQARRFRTRGFYDLLGEYLKQSGSDLTLDGNLLRNPEGKVTGYCTITYSSDTPKGDILLVTLNPNHMKE